MFTGIIEELGTVKKVTTNTIEIAASKVLEDVHIGDSIAVNGVCLTVVSFSKNDFCADVMPETMRCTALGRLAAGKKVNLERALTLNGRLGGHVVSGHVDHVGVIREIHEEDNAKIISVEVPSEAMDYIIPKGSVAIDGVSLTVVDTADDSFRVSLIPHTQQETDLHLKKVGDPVNIETDILAKYAVNLLSRNRSSSQVTKQKITAEFLAEHGFDS